MPTLTFSTSGNWTALASSIDCQCWAEGGHGGAGITGGSSHSGGGGGGGEYAEETALVVTSGNLYSFTIGQGGSTTNTSFPGDAVTVTAHYGGTAAGPTAGVKGTGSTNSIHFNGGAGGNGLVHSDPGGGGGGGGAGSGGSGSNGGSGGLGGNAAGGSGGSGGGGTGGNGGSGTSLSNPGSGGNTFGGGGGGGSGRTGGTSGGSGAAGQIVIIYSGAMQGTASLSGEGTLTAFGGPLLAASLSGEGTLTAQRAGSYNASLAGTGTLTASTQQKVLAALAGSGSLSAYGGASAPAVINQWANNYGQGTTFTDITNALQSCVLPLTPAYSYAAAGGSGTPTPGNWLFCIVSWTQDPSIAKVHIGTGDDIHSYWREYPASSSTGNVRTSISYTPNTAELGTSGTTVGNVYVAPDMEIAAINVLVVEVSGLGNWDTVTGTNTAYDAASESITLALGSPPGHAFTIAGVGGDNASSGQAFLPSGWLALQTQSQSNGVNTLADNILTSAYLPNTASSVSVSGTASTNENLSGFLLQVLITGTDPIPSGHNPNWPYIIFEAGFGAGFNTPDSEVTWTDISSRLWAWDETTGIQFELGQLQSTNLTVHLDDFDGYLNPLNASSPYYPNVQPGTPLRMRAALGTMGGVLYDRWYIIQRNAAQWGEEIDEVFRRYNSVTATDLWAALSSTPPTFYRSEVYEDNPYAWWPMDDQPGTSGVLPTYLLNAAIGNSNVLNIKLSPSGGVVQPYLDEDGRNTTEANAAAPGSADSSPGHQPGIAIYTVGADAGWMFGDPQGAPASLGTGNPETSTPGSAAWQASGQAGSSGSYGWYLICNDNSFPSLSAGITVEIWFNASFYGTSTAWTTYSSPTATSYPITAQPYKSPITIWEMATASAATCVLQLDTSGHLNLITAGTSHVVYTGSDLRSESWHMVTVTLTTTTWQAWLDGGANANVSGSASMSSAWEYFICNGDFGSFGGGSPGSLVHGGNIALSHLAIYSKVLPYYRILDHYWAAVTAFGQLPAPSGVQITWVNGTDARWDVNSIDGASGPIDNFYAADGTAGGTSGGYNGTGGTGLSVVVTANAPGATSGSSAWVASATAYRMTAAINSVGDTTSADNVFPWVSWTGVAPYFDVYISAVLGSETESAVVNGSGDSFTGGYGSGASSAGVCKVSGGNGSSPPAAPSAIGDTVGSRIERLMRGGRCSSPNRCIDPAPLLVQAPGVNGGGTQVGAQIQAIQQSDDGMLYVDNCNHLTYWQRPHLASQYSVPVWNIGPTTSAGRIPYYKEIQWITDPQRTWNTIGITPLSPTGAALPTITPTDASAVDSSQIRYGAQPYAVTSYLQDITEMQAQADWLFSVYGTPQRRAQQVKIDAAAYPLAWELVLRINIGDIVQLEDWIIGGGGTVYTYRVTEMERKITCGFGNNPGQVAEVTLTLDHEPSDGYWS